MSQNNKRLLAFDAIKLFAIFLVVYGHCILHLQNYSYDIKENIIYRFVSSFHMPLFMAISGYFGSKIFNLKFSDIVAKKWKYGIINEYGKIVLPLNYDYIERFSQYSPFNDIFLATQGQTVTVFDKNVRKLPVKDITSYLYEDNKLYISDINGKKGLLDYFGTQTIPFKYDTLYASHPLD